MVKGLKASGRQFKGALPMILVAFVLAGVIQVIIPEEFVRQWLSREAGIRGIFLGIAGGTILATGPYATFPIVLSVYGAGAGLGTIVSLIAGWCLFSISRLPHEFGFLGPRFTIIRLALSVPLCIGAGIVAHIVDIYIF